MDEIVLRVWKNKDLSGVPSNTSVKELGAETDKGGCGS